jgi:hypothetical protein
MSEPRILVVNHAHTVVCGIHDIGVRIHHRLTLVTEPISDRSQGPQCGYAECASMEDYQAACSKVDPTAVIVNYRSDLMPWFRPDDATTTIAVLHNYTHATVVAQVGTLRSMGFDRVLAMDPSLDPAAADGLIVTTRPLPWTPQETMRSAPPRIGSFGFAFPHKGFDRVAEQVQTLPAATYVLHAPEAYFNGAQGAPLYGPAIFDACAAWLIPRRHQLHMTSDHRPADDVVELLASCDVNCLLYAPGQPDAGVSSALDYLVAAGRPILVSEASMFAHAAEAVAGWPSLGLADVLDDWATWQQMVVELRTWWNRDFARNILAAL